MISNFHTHTVLCDGKSSPEELVLSAIEKGFSSLGFSGHAPTDFDQSYCLKDLDAYIAEISALKEKYKKDIQIYLGAEEDIFAPVNRNDFEYLISSCHYFKKGENIYPFDSTYEMFTHCLSLFDGDLSAFAENYYQTFSEYVKKRKPDMIGHFDLITKYDESKLERFLGDENYWKIAEKYLFEAMKSESIFEVNTGLISRGHRSTPCPHERLLRVLYKNGGKITVSADSHQIETLDFQFKEMKDLLKDIGFKHIYLLYDNEWKKDEL